MKQLDIEYDTRLANKDVFLCAQYNSGRVEKSPFKMKSDGKMPKKMEQMYNKLQSIPTVVKVYVSNR